MEGECKQGADDEIPWTEEDHTDFGDAVAQELDDALANSQRLEDPSSYYADELDKEFATNVVSASVSQLILPPGFL